jgi:hypothetical protein
LDELPRLLQKRDDNTQKLLRYVFGNSEVPEGEPLLELTPQECVEKSANEAFRAEYGQWAIGSSNRRLHLLRLVSESNAAGFSSAPTDLFWDALPALIVLPIGGVFVVWYAWALRRRYVHRRPAERQATERP